MTLFDFHSHRDVQRIFMSISQKRNWGLKNKRGQPKKTQLHSTSFHENWLTLSVIWPYADCLFLQRLLFAFFQSVLQILCKPWLAFAPFSCSLIWNITAVCLAGTMPAHLSPCLSDFKALESSALNIWVLSRCFHLNLCSLSLLNTLPVNLRHPYLHLFLLWHSDLSVSFNLSPGTWSQKSQATCKKGQDYL